MKSRPMCAVAAVLIACGNLMIAVDADGQTPPITFAETKPASDAAYLADFASLQLALQKLDDANASCQMSSLTSTGQDRDVFMLTLSADAANADSKPAIMIVAGLDARHRVGVETTVRIAGDLLAMHADLLKDATFYIVPCANPDGFARNGGAINFGHIGNVRAVDSDRDGAADEDGPQDLNGDGVISQMRRVDPPLDDRATHMADPVEPRLLKKPDAAKGEKATFSVYVEGLDADDDGVVAEDGVGEVDLDHNFMHRYPANAADAGSMPLSEPESLALADFVIKRKNLVAVITYGRHDNLLNVPDGRGTDVSGQGPRDLDAGDVEYYKEIAKKYKEITGQTRAAGGDSAGSFEAWVYAQRGIPSFASTLWGRPDAKDEPKIGGEKNAEANPRDAVSGDWAGSVNIPDVGDIPYTFTLALAADNSITGSTTTMGATVKLTGTFDPATGGGKITGDFGGETATYAVTFKDDVMTGTYAMAGESIEFTAKRAAASTPSESTDAKPQATATAPSNDANAPAAAAPQDAPQQNPPAGGGRRGGGRRGGAAGGPAGPGGPQGGGGAPPSGGQSSGESAKPEDAEGAAWLKYSDTVRSKEGFIEWKSFDHPTLGKVEIGGFVPGFQMNPPPAELDEIAAKQTLFIVEILGRRPRINVQGPEITKLASGLYEIRLGIVNDGYLPTATSMARKARSIHPSVVRISTPIENIVSGDRVIKTYGVGGSGDRATYHWIIRADDGGDIAIDITNPHLGDQHLTIKAE